MNPTPETDPHGLPLFEPDPEAAYTIEVVAELTGVSPQTILCYQEQGLITPVAHGDHDTRRFDDEALRTLRRLEHLRATCGLNDRNLRLMLGLLDEVERLRAELRSRRRVG